MLYRIAHLLKMRPPNVGDAGLLFSSGTTVPTDGTYGYQTGCEFQKTDGGAGTSLYINEGSLTSCDFNAVAGVGNIARSSITQEDLVKYTIPLASLRTFDDVAVNLPAAAAADDMGCVTGTPGTDVPVLKGVDFGGTTSDEKGAFEFALPAEYVAGQTITLRVRGGILTTISDGTCTIDVSVWASDGDGAAGSDICATALQSINSLTLANKDFTITPTGLVAGDRLHVQLSFAGSDTGNAGVMVPVITELQMLLDIKG